MRRLGLMLGACLSLLGLGSSCSTEPGVDTSQNADGGTQNDDGGTPSYSASCGELGKAVCTKRIACSAFATKVDGPNFETCVTLVAADCDISTKVPDAVWNEDAARSCAQSYASLSCDDASTSNIPMVCRPPGKRALGAACGDGNQCQSLRCSRPTATSCGTCVPLPKLNEACAGACDFGLQCNNGLCLPYRGLGEICDFNFECLPSLSCMTGTCKTPLLGGACNQPWECSFDALQYCDGGTLTCEELPITVSKIDGTCGSGATFTVLCPRDAYCRIPSGGSSGLCAKLPVAGQACATVGSGADIRQICRAPYTCMGGTCSLFDRAACN